jgi:hypothetical protein
MQKYLVKVRDALVGLSKFEIKHIPREENTRADLLSKLASTKKASNYHSMIEEVLPYPSLTLQVLVADRRTPLIDYIERGVMPEDDKEAKHIVKKATRFTVIEGHLFRNGISTPLLKCIGPEEVWNVLVEIHEGSCGHHVGAKSLARKAQRAGYFWPTLQEGATNHIKKCK